LLGAQAVEQASTAQSERILDESDTTANGVPNLRDEAGKMENASTWTFLLTARVSNRIGIPTFSTFDEHRRHIALNMAAVFRNWARVGFTEGISGHISVRDPEFPHLMWMNPIGKHFALLNAGDMLCLDINTGKIVGGNRVRAVS
jgi:hypothetical protein